jgi:UDP-N-acetylmuramate dehydrogenase
MIANQDLLEQLRSIAPVRLMEPMSRHTTFGVGGPADMYMEVVERSSLREVIVASARYGTPWCVLGSGSNVLVGDAGIRGLVVHNKTQVIDGPHDTENGQAALQADSGVSFASLARQISRLGYWGLDWAAGIPGTIGGAVVYNAGAYGGSIADALVSVEIALKDGTVETIPADSLGLEYRGSGFTRGLISGRVILSAELRVRRGDADEIMRRVAELDTKRKQAQPPGRNAGSIFKNPADRPAWWYIDQVGLRGARIGDAEISAKHANFFMNRGAAKATDVKALMDEASERVHDRFGVELHPEVALIGDAH